MYDILLDSAEMFGVKISLRARVHHYKKGEKSHTWWDEDSGPELEYDLYIEIDDTLHKIIYPGTMNFDHKAITEKILKEIEDSDDEEYFSLVY